jgi:hypothetical protein
MMAKSPRDRHKPVRENTLNDYLYFQYLHLAAPNPGGGRLHPCGHVLHCDEDTTFGEVARDISLPLGCAPEDKVLSHYAVKWLQRKPFEYALDDIGPEEEKSFHLECCEWANREMLQPRMTEGQMLYIPAHHQRRLSEITSPRLRWAALKSLFFIVGDQETLNQFERHLTSAIKDHSLLNKDVDEYLNVIMQTRDKLNRTSSEQDYMPQTRVISKIIFGLKGEFSEAKKMLALTNKVHKKVETSWEELRNELLTVQRSNMKHASESVSSDEEEEEAKSKDKFTGNHAMVTMIRSAIQEGIKEGVKVALSHHDTQYGRGAGRGNMKCSLCGKTNHTKDRCFGNKDYKGKRPEWWLDKQGKDAGF